uniref:Uncharacterized protein n=1 Tax=Anguilla anguilla TaxID=7936 RepID=A0A0E9SK50_ANGAN
MLAILLMAASQSRW